MQLPTHFFLTQGVAESDVSPLNCFDAALLDAGVTHCNLVPVSSILPKGCEEIQVVPSLPPGCILHCVLARAEGIHDGVEGDQISAALAFGIGPEHGIVAEFSGKVHVTRAEHEVCAMLDEMARMRDMSLSRQEVLCATVPKVTKRHGCAVVVLGLCM
mgnify:CR=1 FL=1|jgi:arginine decarboxylase